jgi:lysophospholipase L1-like esterase
MLARLKSDVFAYKPEVLFIMGGTNDLGQNISQATTIANLRAVIVAASAKGIRIDLMTIPPDAYPDMAQKIDSLNAAIVHLGNIYKLVVIDIHTPLSTSTGVYVRKYTSDGIHFTALGAQIVANTIYSRIHRYGF